MNHLLTTLFLLLICFQLSGQQRITTLDKGWEYSHADSANWRPASLPGCVHTDLMEWGMPDPFTGQGEATWQWVSESDWVYRCTFGVDDFKWLHMPVLVFEGLDTYARVVLNGKDILHADNAFHPWEVDVAGILKKKKNKLEVYFESPLKKGQALADASPHPLPGAPVRAVTRKPQYQYGWDWGPTLPSMGISGEVRLEDHSTGCVRSFSVSTLSANTSTAELRVVLEVESPIAHSGQWSLGFEDAYTTVPVDLKAGLNKLEHVLTVSNPELWWPREMGEQPLYPIQYSLTTPDIDVGDVVFVGIRTAELDTTTDDDGERFVLRINGYPVFAKGANYIPQDVFLHRVEPQAYAHLIEQCVGANMNMLRVWGGGVYEREVFYELCDEAGIMVWQDFMFACAMYPGDDAFVENLEQEAAYQIKRLENHPSVVLWCGNNENSEGWHRWGWQAGLDSAQRADTWESYSRVFQDVLPTLVDSLSTLPYWESSPSLGRGDERFRFQGDAHDWTVWHDAAPFDRFRSHIPRFMSEFGFQSLPTSAVLSHMTKAPELTLGHPDLAVHQKHHRGFELMDIYMERDFGTVPTDLDSYRYLSQIQQAWGMGMGMRAHRTAAPFCMGSLYWQLNDCWPAISWSSLDQNGQWKAVHYAAKSAFEPFMSDAWITDGTLYVKAALPAGPDEKVHTLRGSVHVQTMQGEYVSQLPIQTRGLPGHAVSILEMPLKRMVASDSTLLNLIVTVDLASESYALNKLHFTGVPKNWRLPASSLNLYAESVDMDTYMVTVSSETFVYGVELSCQIPGVFTDNYFNLSPGELRTIYFRRNAQGEAPTFRAVHLADVLNPD